MGASVGRYLIFAGLVLVALGALILLTSRLDLPLGRLPGDLTWRGKNTAIYFPWLTCLLVSLLGSLLIWIFNRR